MTQKVIKKIALAVFKDKKLLMVRSHNNPLVFYTLGGKSEPGENDIACLQREVREEINCEVDTSSLKFIKEFEEIAHGKENTRLHIRFYEGIIKGTPVPTSEIAEISWFDTSSDPIHLSQMAINQIFPYLKENNYIY